MLDRGGIYLAKLYPTRGHEVGKRRPVLVLQSNILNQVGHTTVIVVPLTTRCIEGAYPLRFTVNKRGKLERDSQLLCDQIRAIDIHRITHEKLASLTEAEMLQIEIQIGTILDFKMISGV